MSAHVTSPDQFGPWHHGTGHWFKEGDVVSPTDTIFTIEPHAYAAQDQKAAGRYASRHAQGKAKTATGEQGTSLFRPIYEVEPMSDRADVKNSPNVSGPRLRDPEGLRVKGISGYGAWNGELA